MNRSLSALPFAIVASAALGMLVYGPIEQLADYHAFADQQTRYGIAHFADVASNLPFVLVAVVAMLASLRRGRDPVPPAGLHGYWLFAWSIALTAIGSSFYHLAPDDTRLVWDRLPIALACAGLLCAVHADQVGQRNPLRTMLTMALLATASVAWWHYTDATGHGDLRPYLLLQVAPLVLIPLWQTDAPTFERRLYLTAIVLYVVAKIAEVDDRAVLLATGGISGHTIKHLLSAAAAGVIVLAFARSPRPRAIRRADSLHVAPPMTSTQPG